MNTCLLKGWIWLEKSYHKYNREALTLNWGIFVLKQSKKIILAIKKQQQLIYEFEGDH